MGGLAGLLTGIPFVGGAIGSQIDKFQPKSYWDKLPDSEKRRLNALNITPYNEQKISIQNDVPMASINRWTSPINNFEDTNITGGANVNDFKGVNFNNTAPVDNSQWNEELWTGAKDGGRIGYQGGELVEQETDFIQGPQGTDEFQETVVEGEEQPSREQLEALAMEIFQLPLEELDDQQLLVVYQEAMQGQPMEESVQEEDVQFAANGGLAGLL